MFPPPRPTIIGSVLGGAGCGRQRLTQIASRTAGNESAFVISFERIRSPTFEDLSNDVDRGGSVSAPVNTTGSPLAGLPAATAASAGAATKAGTSAEHWTSGKGVVC